MQDYHDLWQIANRVFSKGKSVISLFNSPKVLPFVSDKAKVLAEIFSESSF